MPTVQNEAIRPLVRASYTLDDLARIESFLRARGTLQLARKDNGLYPAVPAGAPSAAHYGRVWLRDNVMIVHHLHETGHTTAAAMTLSTLRSFFERHLDRFDAITDGRADPADPMMRPHIRFDGDTLDELPETWPHAQNDALGYFLWMTFRLCRERPAAIPHDARFAAVTCRFPAYFAAIDYPRDADSGHWEEARKVESSSIGAVVAGLAEMAAFLREDPSARAAFARAPLPVTVDALDALIEKGRTALDAFLPAESPPARTADAALLFLIYPLSIVTRSQADAILDLVLGNLQGDHGIMRYRGDSYWCGGYKQLFGVEQRTADFSTSLADRDRLLVPGTEAQWTIFDPVVSVLHARRYQADRRPEDLAAQTHHLNRALAQITAEDFTVDGVPRGGQCPEAYYVADPANLGVRVPNDHVPLAWTQANLAVALAYMERSLSLP